MILMEESKTGHLVPHKVGEEIAPMPLGKFLDRLDCIEEDAVWCSFEMKDLVSKISGSTHIWTIDEYAEFTGWLSKSEIKWKVFLRLANVEEDEEEKDS